MGLSFLGATVGPSVCSRGSRCYQHRGEYLSKWKCPGQNITSAFDIHDEFSKPVHVLKTYGCSCNPETSNPFADSNETLHTPKRNKTRTRIQSETLHTPKGNETLHTPNTNLRKRGSVKNSSQISTVASRPGFEHGSEMLELWRNLNNDQK